MAVGLPCWRPYRIPNKDLVVELVVHSAWPGRIEPCRGGGGSRRPMLNASISMPVPRSRARQFCQAVSDEASGRVGRWVDIAAVGERLRLDLDRAIVLADDCEQAG